MNSNIQEIGIPDTSSVGVLQEFLIELDELEEKLDKRSKDFKLYKDLWNQGIERYHKLVGEKIWNKK